MVTAIWRNICEGDVGFRFGGTAADLLSFQPGVRGSDRVGGEGEVGGGDDEGEGGVGGGSKSPVDGADQGLRLEEGGDGHQEREQEEDLGCCGKPRQPFIMTGEEFDR